MNLRKSTQLLMILFLGVGLGACSKNQASKPGNYYPQNQQIIPSTVTPPGEPAVKEQPLYSVPPGTVEQGNVNVAPPESGIKDYSANAYRQNNLANNNMPASDPSSPGNAGNTMSRNVNNNSANNGANYAAAQNNNSSNYKYNNSSNSASYPSKNNVAAKSMPPMAGNSATAKSVAAPANRSSSSDINLAVEGNKAWQQVGKALQKTRYKILDQDNGLSSYYVLDTASTNNQVTEHTPIYRVHIQSTGSNSQVVLLNQANRPAESAVTQRILGAIKQQLGKRQS